MPQYTLHVSQEDLPQRLDVFLAQNLDAVSSRTFVKQLIGEGLVTVNHKAVKPHQKVKAGDEVLVDIPALEPVADIAPQDIALDIFYEDPFLSVINKPAGMLVHPTASCREGTLVNALLHRYRDLSCVNETTRPGIVHRLDRETSGLIVVVKDNRSHIRLARQFEKHRVRKKYVALVKGAVAYDEGVIDAGLDRHPIHFDKKAVSFEAAARTAKTFYRVLRRNENGTTLIALFPQTGRTHQLRVHMAYLGHPILGDDKYGAAHSFFRLALHAQSVGFEHPHTGRFVEFSTPIPPEFVRM